MYRLSNIANPGANLAIFVIGKDSCASGEKEEDEGNHCWLWCCSGTIGLALSTPYSWSASFSSESSIGFVSTGGLGGGNTRGVPSKFSISTAGDFATWKNREFPTHFFSCNLSMIGGATEMKMWRKMVIDRLHVRTRTRSRFVGLKRLGRGNIVVCAKEWL